MTGHIEMSNIRLHSVEEDVEEVFDQNGMAKGELIFEDWIEILICLNRIKSNR